eukprot:gene6358-6851_t
MTAESTEFGKDEIKDILDTFLLEPDEDCSPLVLREKVMEILPCSVTPLVDEDIVEIFATMQQTEECFDISYLRDFEAFEKRLLERIPSIDSVTNEKILAFKSNINSHPSIINEQLLSTITKAIFDKEYDKLLRSESRFSSNKERRKHYNDLELILFAYAIREILQRTPYTISKKEFVEKVGLTHLARKEIGEEGLELLFRFTLPWFVFVNQEMDSDFFKRRKGIMMSLGEFFEYSNIHYSSGGGRTKATRLRESCFELITGCVSKPRKRKSKVKDEGESISSSSSEEENESYL